MLWTSLCSGFVLTLFIGPSLSDIHDCGFGTIRAKCFRCLTCGKTIITADQICDGKFDCPDITDEFLCSQKQIKYKSQVHYVSTVFGIMPWNPDSAVEMTQRMCIPNCTLPESHRHACKHCKPGEIQCSPTLRPDQSNHTCVSKQQLCNGVQDCPHGEDELYCGAGLAKHSPTPVSTDGSGDLESNLDAEMENLGKMPVSCNEIVNRTHGRGSRGHWRGGPPPDVIEGWIRFAGSRNLSRGLPFSHPNTPPHLLGQEPPHVHQALIQHIGAPQVRVGEFISAGVISLGIGDFPFDPRQIPHLRPQMVDRFFGFGNGNVTPIPESTDTVEFDRICDGTSDCPGQTDELFCLDKFYCKGKSPLYVDKKMVRDGHDDCDDGSDEIARINPQAFGSRYNLIDNWTLQVLVWIMAFTALIGNLIVICNTSIDLVKHNRVATATALLRSRRTSIQDIDPKNGKTRLSRVSMTSLRTATTGSSRFRSNGSGISGHRRLVRIWNSVLVLNLATADLIMGVYLMCLAVMSFLYEEESQNSHQHGSFDREWRTSSTCQVLGTMLVISSQTSVYTLVSLTSLRLHTVLRPFSSYHLKFRYLAIAVVGTWSLSSFSAVAPLLPSLRDFFVQKAWVPFPQFQPPVINRTTADALVRGIAYITNTSITTDPTEMVSPLSWNTMLAFVQRVAPSHSDWQFYSYYSEDSVCMPKLYTTQNDSFWKHAISNIVINFLSVLYISCAYITIYCKSAKEGKSTRRFSRGQRKESIPADPVAGNKWNRSSVITRRDQGSVDQGKTGQQDRNTSYLRRRPRSSGKTSRILARNSTSEMQRRIALLVITDCVCWVPICIMSFISISGRTIPDAAFAITAIGLLPINSALNPLLYSRVLQTLWTRGLSSLRVRVASVRNSFESSDSSSGGKIVIDKKLSSISGVTVEDSVASSDYSPPMGRHAPLAETFSTGSESSFDDVASKMAAVHKISRMPLEVIAEHPTAIEVS